MRAELEESVLTVARAELPRLRRLAYAMCGDWHRADDLVQEALERVYAAWPRAHTATDPGAYLRTTLVRRMFSEARRPWRRREHSRDELPESSAGDHAGGVVHRLDLAGALAGLTVKQRAVVVLRYLEDRPVDEVATILGIAAGTVKRQSHDALARLRRDLTGQYLAENGGGVR